MSYQREFESRVRVGVVGVGSHAYRNVLPMLNFLPVELVAIADPAELLRAATAEQYGLRDHQYPDADAMYRAERLDAVLLCVSPRHHPALAIAAFAAGLHVWMEKPASTTAAEVAGMIAARGDLIATVGYKKAFMPAAVKARELIATGATGAVSTILAQFPTPVPPLDATDRDRSAWLDACHPLSLILSLAGPVDTVTTHRAAGRAGAVVMRHVNGVVSNLHLIPGAPAGQPFERYTVFGSLATVEIDNGRRLSLQRGMQHGYATSMSFAPPGLDSGAIVWEAQDSLNTLENKSEFTQGLHGGLLAFLEGVLVGRQPEFGSLEFARELAAIAESAVASDGGPIAAARS